MSHVTSNILTVAMLVTADSYVFNIPHSMCSLRMICLGNQVHIPTPNLTFIIAVIPKATENVAHGHHHYITLGVTFQDLFNFITM